MNLFKIKTREYEVLTRDQELPPSPHPPAPPPSLESGVLQALQSHALPADTASPESGC